MHDLMARPLMTYSRKWTIWILEQCTIPLDTAPLPSKQILSQSKPTHSQTAFLPETKKQRDRKSTALRAVERYQKRCWDKHWLRKPEGGGV